jgi:predicted dinucleotide-binding enzyme
MRIGIIGAGVIGRHLALKLSKKGHQILIANSRGPHTIDFADNDRIKAVELLQTTKGVDTVILTIPTGQVPKLPKELFSQLNSDVHVIDTMNYVIIRDGVIEELERGKAQSVWLQEQIGRPVIRAFNNIVAVTLVREGLPKGTPGRIALAVSGDNKEWVNKVIQLVDDTGFDGFDAGSLAESWRQESGNPAYCTDLTLEEAKEALSKANRDNSLINKEITLQNLFALGEEHMKILISGNYPEDFENKIPNMYRSFFGIPQKEYIKS